MFLFTRLPVFFFVLGFFCFSVLYLNGEDKTKINYGTGLSQQEIDNYIAEYNKMYLRIDGVKYPIFNELTSEMFKIVMEGISGAVIDGLYIVVYLPDRKTFMGLEGNRDNKTVTLSLGDIVGSAVGGDLDFIAKYVNTKFPLISNINPSEEVAKIQGSGMVYNIRDKKDSKSIDFFFNQFIVFGTGTAQVNLMSPYEIFISGGSLGVSTYVMIKKLIKDNPKVHTVVLGQVDGSIDDYINMETGRLIRSKSLNTKLLSDSSIASGAVDLFSSGVERIYTSGAQVGVHSWCCGENGEEAIKIPADDESHYGQLSYFTQMLPETGYDFYFYTLKAARFDDVHYMSVGEMKKYQLITK